MLLSESKGRLALNNKLNIGAIMTCKTGLRSATLWITNPSRVDDLMQGFLGKTCSLKLQDVCRHHKASTPRPGWLFRRAVYCITENLLYLDEQYKTIPSKLQCMNQIGAAHHLLLHSHESCKTPA